MAGGHAEPINLGSSELVSINQLVDIVEEIAGVRLRRRYKLDAPKGVRGRNSDNAEIRRVLGWEPSITLRDGMARTYAWIWEQMTGAALTGAEPAPVLQEGVLQEEARHERALSELAAD